MQWLQLENQSGTDERSSPVPWIRPFTRACIRLTPRPSLGNVIEVERPDDICAGIRGGMR
jgi:hypothetical protein